MVRIWFNHWFSTAYNIINLIKEDKEMKFHVIGTNQRVHAVIKNVCDEWYEEPVLEEEDYIEYCLAFCKEHAVDLFVPRRRMVEISKNIHRFHAIGVKVMVDAYEKISLLNDKAKTYDLFKESLKIRVPDYKVVTTVAGFKDAFEQLRKGYERVCVKFVQDEGGMSFRQIDDSKSKYSALSGYQGAKISYDALLETLSEKETFKDLIVMPFLPGNEISVDCLTTKKGLIAIPRIKETSRNEVVEFREDIIDMCTELLLKVPLENPCNIQFKYFNDIPYLLEVNTRMSGGVQMGCLSTGTNLPNLAVNKILGVDKDWKMDRRTKRVTYIEMPKLVEDVEL